MGKRRSAPDDVEEDEAEEEDSSEGEIGDGERMKGEVRDDVNKEDRETTAKEGGEAEDEEQNDYRLEFETGMDPLAFAEEDENGVAPFQQFEKLEYEVLAARKRKALALKRGSGTVSTTKSAAKQNEIFGAGVDEIWDSAGMGSRGGGRRRKKRKKLGRPKGSTLTPETRKKLGEANVLYAIGKFDEAVEILKEVVRLAPNVPDSYHTLGLLYDALGDRKKALNFYMIAAHLTPKDTALWKRLASWSMEQGNVGQVIYCLTKAIKADQEDVDAKWDRASLYAERNEYAKAAEAFEQILLQRPSDVEVCKMVAKMYHKIGQLDRATQVLEKLIEEHSTEADLTAVNLLAELHMEKGAFATAIAHIDHARTIYCSEVGLPLDLSIKAGICHAYLGNLEDAESYFEELPEELADEGCGDLVMDVADVYLALGKHDHALQYYTKLQSNKTFDNAALNMKIAQCHSALQSATAAIELYYKVVEELPQHVEARVALASLLAENGDHPAAVAVLSPPESSAKNGEQLPDSDERHPWWHDGAVRKKLAELHYAQGEHELYVAAILPAIQATLLSKHYNLKGKTSKRLSKSVLVERSKWLEERPANEVFHGFRPVLSTSDTVKASRARRALARLTAEKEAKKAAALAAGLDYDSKEESEEDSPPKVLLADEQHINFKQQTPLRSLVKDGEHYELLLRCCKTLASLKRPWEALEIIQHALEARDGLPKEQRDELRALGAQISFETRDVKYGFNCVRHAVLQRPYSTSAWNHYYQVVSRSEVRVHKHNKFLLQMRKKYPDCTAPMMICGHQFNMINQQQGTVREYLHAYKLQPEDPFINLCVGTAFINLSLGFRLNNRSQCIMQGFGFLYKYQRLVKSSQESNYNLARAFHHVGLLQPAVTYYEKVLNHYEKDHRNVQLPHLTADTILATVAQKEVPTENDIGHCNLHREAAYNLHLIYKRSGAFHLARQVLLDHCTV